MHFLFSILFYILIFFHIRHRFQLFTPEFIGMQNYSTLKKSVAFELQRGRFNKMQLIFYTVRIVYYIQCSYESFFLARLRHTNCSQWHLYQIVCLVPFCLPTPIQSNSPIPIDYPAVCNTVLLFDGVKHECMMLLY